MAKYRRKLLVVDATQWFKNGDHPQDNCETFKSIEGEPFQGEGKVVRYYRTPDLDGQTKCEKCGNIMHLHGWIDEEELGYVVCPGDMVITREDGQHRPMKLVEFDNEYEQI